MNKLKKFGETTPSDIISSYTSTTELRLNVPSHNKLLIQIQLLTIISTRRITPICVITVAEYLNNSAVKNSSIYIICK